MAKQLFLLLLVLSSASSFVFSQIAPYRFAKDSVDRNPFSRNSVIANEQEIMLITDNVSGSQTAGPVQHRIYNLSPIPSLIPGNAFSSTVVNDGNRHMESASGDFNHDNLHEVVVAWQSGQNIFLSLPSIEATTFDIGATVSTLLHPAALPPANNGLSGRIIIRAGDFDGDDQSEFVVAYRSIADSMLHIDVFDVDSASLIIQHASGIADESFPLISLQSYEPFDMITKDLDADGRDEVIVVGVQEGGGNHNLYCKLYKVSGSGSALALSAKGKTVFNNTIDDSKFVYIKVAAGDFNSDLLNEVAVAYSYQLDNYPSTIPDSYVEILRPADSTATNPLQPDYLETLVDSNYLFGINQNENSVYPFCIASADLDLDGFDEIVVSYDGSVVRILKSDGNYSINQAGVVGVGFTNAASPYYDNFLAIADMNRDGMYDIINVKNAIDQNSTPFKQELSISVHGWDTTLSIYTVIASIDNLEVVDETSSGPERQFTFAVGDFDNDRIRFGDAKKHIYSQMKHPLVILNSPPVHFDTLAGGLITDVAGVYPSPPVNNDFRAQYTSLTAQSMTLQTVENSAWEASAELKFQDSIGGVVNVEASIKATYGRKFSNTQSSLTKVTVSTLNTAYTDDLIYGWVTDYLVYEYPVLVDDSLVGFITSLVPINGQKTWFGATDPLGYEVRLNHESGNILSYPDYQSVFDDPDLQQGIKADFSNSYSVGPSANFQWAMEFSEINTSVTDTTKEGSLEGSLEVGAFGAGLKLSGNYNFSNTSTLTNTIQSDIKFDISMGPLAGGIADPNYRVNPYLIWAQNGSVTLNYAVHPETPSTGFPTSWWWQNYQIQDPALILPWRLFPEKGFPLLDQSKRTLSKSIWFSRPNPAPGDTVDIHVQVHNFSVSPTTGPVEVSLFLGDPNNGGVPITSVTGQTSVSTAGPLIKQGREEVQFRWVAPQGILPDPRIFAWLDAANTMTEVHEANNLGWIPLGVNYPLVGLDENNAEVTSGSMYPNPVYAAAYFPVLLKGAATVRFEIYNINGLKVFEVPERNFSSGEHHIRLDLKSLASGVYICRMFAENNTSTTKFVVARMD